MSECYTNGFANIYESSALFVALMHNKSTEMLSVCICVHVQTITPKHYFHISMMFVNKGYTDSAETTYSARLRWLQMPHTGYCKKGKDWLKRCVQAQQ